MIRRQNSRNAPQKQHADRPPTLMTRFHRFAENAGLVRILQSVVVLALMGFALRRDFSTGNWTFTVPLLAGVFVLAFLIRDFLVENFSWVRWIMNAAVIAGILAAVFSRKVAPEPLWIKAAIAGCLGFYMSCYFWTLSDERMAIEH